MSALDDLIDDVGTIRSISLRDWPDDFPVDIATQRHRPYESQVDSIMYRYGPRKVLGAPWNKDHRGATR